MTAHPLTPPLEALMEALPTDMFRMGDQLVGGVIVAANHSPDMLRNLVRRMDPVLTQMDESDHQAVFRALIQYSGTMDRSERQAMLDEFLDRAVDPHRLGDYIHDFVTIMGGEEVVEAYLAIARLLRRQPKATRCEQGVMMCRRILRDLLAIPPSDSLPLHHPCHPLREALGLVPGGYPGAAALLEKDWVKYASKGDLFGITNPEAGQILQMLVEWGADPNRCLARIMNYPEAGLYVEDLRQPVTWCLDAGATYHIVVNSQAAWKDELLVTVRQHPSWRRMALGEVAPTRGTGKETRAL